MSIWQTILGWFGFHKQPVQPVTTAPIAPVATIVPTNQVGSYSLSLDPSGWYQEYVAAGGNTIPARKPLTSMVETIPDHSSGKYISYLLHPINPVFSSTSADPTPHYLDISKYKSLTVKFRVNAPANVKWFYDSEPGNTPDKCPTPAHVRPFLSHSQLNLQSWNWRWFAHYLDNGKETAAYQLDSGNQEVTLTVPLTQDHWVSVYPGRDGEKEGWDTMIHNASYIGWVFGGGCAYAHGLNVIGGPVTFELLEYTLNV